MSIKRSPAQIERDRREIARMYLAGEIQADIAEKLKINQSTVSRDLKFIQAEWQAARINDIDERKRLELAKIDNLEIEYWQVWKRSQKNAETKTIKLKGEKQAGDKPRPDYIEQYERTEEQVGDPRFLQGVQWCITKRCELLGLDAPKKTDLTSGGKPITWKDFINADTETNDE